MPGLGTPLGHRRTQSSTGLDRNSPTGMPSPPTRSVRTERWAAAKASIPRNVSGSQPLLTSMAVSVLPLAGAGRLCVGEVRPDRGFEVMRQGCRVAGVLQLPEHLVVREDPT